MVEKPKCSCGSTACGLIWIKEEDRYQCGDCIQLAYEKMREDSSFLNALRAAGVDNWEGYSEVHQYLE